METLVNILSELSSIVGVPVTLALAWAAFIIRDQGKRIARLEQENADIKKWAGDELAEVKDKFARGLTSIVDKFEAKLDAFSRDQKQEFSTIYSRIDGMAKTVSRIDGYLFKKHAGE